jgi:prostaglandin-endoperoxide synthase 2
VARSPSTSASAPALSRWRRAIPDPAGRDTSADGFRNKVEVALLGGLRPFWAFVNRTPALSRFFSRIVVDNAVRKAPSRPLALSTMAPYASWASLNDRTWFGRYLPPNPAPGLPPVADVGALFRVRPEGPRLSTQSTLLFPSFAQWFTDGFLMTVDTDRRRTTTNHQIDLSQLYGLHEAHTRALRQDGATGRRGRLRSVTTATGEWAPPLYDQAGAKRPEFEALPDPVKLPPDLPAAKKRTIFAFGGERANATTFTAMINTLFLREHNRLAAVIEAANPGWDDDRVFETARNVSIVQLIRIVVEEYINHISPYWLQLLADPSPAYRAGWNRPNWIPVEFNLLYRWHSLVPEQVVWGGAPAAIGDFRFDHGRLLQDGLEVGLASASASRAWRIGLYNTSDMLLPVEEAAIRQGRDNELATYNDYRALMRYPRVTRFEQISSDPAVVEGLRRVYGHVDRIEYFVGLFAEDLPARSAVPPLIGRMVASDAFSHALTNALLAPLVNVEATFSRAGMESITRTRSLHDLVLRNAGMPLQGLRISMEAEEYKSSA